VDYNKYGAAFLVENMIHGKTEYNADSTLVNAANADYTKWAGYVDDYSDAGRIQWSVSKSVPAGQFNSTHLCVEGSGGYCWARATYYNNNYNSGGYDGHHFDFYTLSDPEPSTLIIFTNPNGTTFQIRRECGNVIGSAGALQELGWNLLGRTLVNDDSGYATTTTLYAGQGTVFTNQLENTGASNANTTWTVQYCYDACSGYSNLTSGTDSSVVKGVTWKTEYLWNFTAPANTTHTKVCARIAYSNGAGPGTATEYASPACATIIPLQSTCNGVVINPTLLGTTDSYTVTGSINTNGGQPGAQQVQWGSGFYITVTGPSVNIANYDVTPVTVGGSAADTGTGTLVASINPSGTGDAGTYSVTYGITGPVGAVDCSGSFTVAYRPYVSVLGGDVSAGAGFGGSCTSNSSNVNSWNLNTANTPNYYGGGSEIGAWASGNITNFVSGIGLAGGAASNNGYGLSFSNTTNTGGAGHGGGYGTNAVPCMYDYYGNKPASLLTLSTGSLTSFTSPTNITSGSYNAPTDGSGTYTMGNGTDMTLGQDPAGNGKQIDVYVNGNLYIKSNIKYSYTSLYQLPHINFYVKGSIFIDPNVTELHGVYIAQKTSGVVGGYLNTCAPGATFAAQSYATCNKQLKVVGAVAAENGLRLTRTFGNLATATGASNQPAEIFQYSPEMWLTQTLDKGYQYQSYTSLTPVL
jgi:hypothetical protein